MSDAQKSAAAPQTAEQVVESGGLLDQIVEQGRLARDPASRERGKNLVKDKYPPEPAKPGQVAREDYSYEKEGRANLFEQSQPRAFDYTFSCSELFRASVGWETYPAKWRKKDGELAMLIPVAGTPGESKECTLRVVMKKDAAYFRRNGQLNEEPVSVFKTWMEKHNYDPEHGEKQPTGLSTDAEGNSKKN